MVGAAVGIAEVSSFLGFRFLGCHRQRFFLNMNDTGLVEDKVGGILGFGGGSEDRGGIVNASSSGRKDKPARMSRETFPERTLPRQFNPQLVEFFLHEFKGGHQNRIKVAARGTDNDCLGLLAG